MVRLLKHLPEALHSKFVYSFGGVNTQSSTILVTVSEPGLPVFHLECDHGMRHCIVGRGRMGVS